MKDIEKIKELLSQASEIIENNIDKAENIDLTHMSEWIDSFVYELDKIDDFEVYGEDEE
jgi:peptide subunit release factor 1 (eRF1)